MMKEDWMINPKRFHQRRKQRSENKKAAVNAIQNKPFNVALFSRSLFFCPLDCCNKQQSMPSFSEVHDLAAKLDMRIPSRLASNNVWFLSSETSVDFVVLDLLERKETTEQTEWQTKQASKLVLVWEDLKCWGAWKTSRGHKAKGITLLIAWKGEEKQNKTTKKSGRRFTRLMSYKAVADQKNKQTKQQQKHRQCFKSIGGKTERPSGARMGIPDRLNIDSVRTWAFPSVSISFPIRSEPNSESCHLSTWTSPELCVYS